MEMQPQKPADPMDMARMMINSLSEVMVNRSDLITAFGILVGVEVSKATPNIRGMALGLCLTQIRKTASSVCDAIIMDENAAADLLPGDETASGEGAP